MRIKHFSKVNTTTAAEEPPSTLHSSKNKTARHTAPHTTTTNHHRGYQSEDDMVLNLKNKKRTSASEKKKTKKNITKTTVPKNIAVQPSTTSKSTTTATTEAPPQTPQAIAAAAFTDSLIVKLWNPDSIAADTRTVLTKLKACADAGGVEGLLSIAEKGGISAIIASMKRHLDCPKIQEIACRVLRLFAKQKETRFTLAKTSNAVSTVINVINYHMKKPTVVMWALSALSNLSQTTVGLNIIASEGGIPACVRALEMYTEDANIQKLSIAILYSSSLSKAQMEEIRKLNPKNALKAASINFPIECGKSCRAILFRLEPETESDIDSV